jgi:hypothetical protein
LRAVNEGERAPQRLTLTEAAAVGDTRQMLVATRDRIALAVENKETPARDLAALTKRLMETQREIEAFDARNKEADAHAEVFDGEFDAAAI